MLAVIGFCHRLHTATSCLPDLANSLRYIMCTRLSHRHRKLQLMFSSPSLDYQSWRKGPEVFLEVEDTLRHLRLQCDPVHRNQFRFFPKYLRQTPLDCHRLPTDAGFKLKSSLRPLSDTLAPWKQNQHCDERGVSSRKDFRWYEAFLPGRGREN